MDAKKWYLSKTLWFNGVAFVVIVLGAFGFQAEIPEGWGIYVPVAVAIVNGLLRLVTKQAIVK
jgi:hypothetical protein